MSIERVADEKKIDKRTNLTKIFAEVIVDFTAGKPQDDTVKWIDLKPPEIQVKLAKINYKVSLYMVQQLANRENNISLES